MSAGKRAGSAADRAHEWLRARILEGTLAGGRLLTEGEVAEAVGLSRTPVREAFVQLAAEGMLELYPKRGALVVMIGAAELRDVMVARALIEPWAARTVARLGDRGVVCAILRADTTTAVTALADGDERGFQEADRAFHSELMAGAGNSALASFHSSLRDRQLRAGTLALRQDAGRATEITLQHEAIADAIEQGDGDAAAASVLSHLNRTAELLGLAPLS
jgi:DNA-binding GntR family transcriptional regulator